MEAYVEALLKHDLPETTKNLLRSINPEKATAARGGRSTTTTTTHPRGGHSWTRDDFIVTLDLYLDDPEIEKRQDDDRVKELAELMKRSSGSVSSRLGNFRALDPRADSGVENVGKPAQEIWDEYYGNEEELAREAELARERFAAGIVVDETPGTASTGSRGEVTTGETTSTTTNRIGQQDFRKEVRDRYDDRCVLCDVDEPGLLQAGHILDWSEFEDPRGDPANGLLLCYTHHRAFDLNMFTLSNDYEIVIRPGMDTESEFLTQTILDREGESVTFPNAPPSAEYLNRHNERIGWLSGRQ